MGFTIRAHCSNGHEWEAEGIPRRCPVKGCEPRSVGVDLRMHIENSLGDQGRYGVDWWWQRDTDQKKVEYVEEGGNTATTDLRRKGRWRLDISDRLMEGSH